jgi:hypothetical protein
MISHVLINVYSFLELLTVFLDGFLTLDGIDALDEPLAIFLFLLTLVDAIIIELLKSNH